MLVGYNHNIMHNGEMYHLQTEDSGGSGMHVTTLLYSAGTIIASKRTDYSYLTGKEDYESPLRELMQNQHKELLINLRDGKYTGFKQVEPEQKPKPELEKTEEEPKLEVLSILEVLNSMESSSLDSLFEKQKKAVGINDNAPGKDLGEAMLDYLSSDMKKDEEKKE